MQISQIRKHQPQKGTERTKRSSALPKKDVMSRPR